MTKPLRLATVIAQSLHTYCQEHTLNPRQWQVCHHILACRTEALGETHLQCERCGQEARFFHAGTAIARAANARPLRSGANARAPTPWR